MTTDRTFKASSLSRWRLLRTVGFAGVSVPLGLLGQRVWAGARLTLSPSGLASPAICRAAVTETIAPAGAPRELKLTWNANAICMVGVPVADQMPREYLVTIGTRK
jgi:NitT/TauT family transport system substrate-binding protein